jgi:hypothetical protein
MEGRPMHTNERIAAYPRVQAAEEQRWRDLIEARPQPVVSGPSVHAKDRALFVRIDSVLHEYDQSMAIETEVLANRRDHE